MDKSIKDLVIKNEIAFFTTILCQLYRDKSKTADYKIQDHRREIVLAMKDRPFFRSSLFTLEELVGKRKMVWWPKKMKKDQVYELAEFVLQLCGFTKFGSSKENTIYYAYKT